MLMEFETDSKITCSAIARKIGTSRQNVHQLLNRLGKKKPAHLKQPIRPWGNVKFIPEIETLLRYLFNRFDGQLTHLGGRQFRLNGHKVFIMRRNCYQPRSNCLLITTPTLDRDSCDFKIVLHGGQIFVVPFIRDYLPITEMPKFHNDFDALK